MWLPVGIGVMLIFAAFVRRAEASQSRPMRSLAGGTPPDKGTNALAATVPAKGGGKALPKSHKNYYPPAGSVVANGDLDWYWDGAKWEYQGVPTFPQGLTLTGLGGGPLDGWYYDWSSGAWIEPAAGAHPGKNLAPAPAPARGPLQRAKAKVMQPAGSTVATQSTATQTAPAPVAPTSSIRVISSSYPVSPISAAPTAVADGATSSIREIATSAVRELSQKDNPHPNDILNTAVIAKKAGYDETAATLTQKAVAKSHATGIPLDTTAVSTIRVTSVPLSNAQRANQADALAASIERFGHAADPQAPETHPAPTPAPMTFEPEVITHSDAMSFAPDIVHHTLQSPLPGIDDGTWTTFAYLFEDDSNSISPQYLLGHFKISALRLEDLGMMKDTRQAKYNGKTVWEGNFVEPLSTQIFLNDPKLQYDTFVKEMQLLSNEVEKKGTSGKIPLKLHGYDVTRSGLLAIAKVAGPKGFDSFIKDNGDWDKYPNTRDAFLKANGLF